MYCIWHVVHTAVSPSQVGWHLNKFLASFLFVLVLQKDLMDCVLVIIHCMIIQHTTYVLPTWLRTYIDYQYDHTYRTVNSHLHLRYCVWNLQSPPSHYISLTQNRNKITQDSILDRLITNRNRKQLFINHDLDCKWHWLSNACVSCMHESIIQICKEFKA
jgi:hypothetical protein